MRRSPISPARQKLDMALFDSLACSTVKDAMRRRQHQLGRYQRTSTKALAVNIQTANSFPCFGFIAIIETLKRRILGHRPRGEQQSNNG